MHYRNFPYQYMPTPYPPCPIQRPSHQKYPNGSKQNINEPNDYSRKESTASKEEKAIFEILGIKLYFDDLLLLCLIFFLYTEGVQDQYLLIALILLLLS